ncbi:hypothetical protein ACB094_03G190400 [Castanea mollissima]
MKMAMKNMKTLGIAEMPPPPPQPPPQPPPSPLPRPPPLGIKDKRTLEMAEKPHPTLAILGIAEKPLPPPPLGFLRQVHTVKNRSGKIEIISIWPDIDGYRWILTRSRKRSSRMESSFDEPNANRFYKNVLVCVPFIWLKSALGHTISIYF